MLLMSLVMTILIKNIIMAKLCKKYNLIYSAMCKMIKGRKGCYSHKGWTRVTE